MPQQLPQIAIVPARNPDLGKVILQHELQDMPRVLAIGLLLAYPLRSDLGCIAPPQLEVQFRQQSLKPTCVSTGFHAHTQLFTANCKIAIKLFRFLGMRESLFLKLTFSVSTKAICWK